jgi:hypothetical protein
MEAEMKQTPIGSGVAAASVGMGYFSLVVFWWYPFAFILSGVGLVLALICLALKVRSRRGENIALIGASLCGTAFGIIFTLTEVLHYMMWKPL